MSNKELCHYSEIYVVVISVLNMVHNEAISQNLRKYIFVDREAREIMYLVASVCPFGCLSDCSHG